MRLHYPFATRLSVAILAATISTGSFSAARAETALQVLRECSNPAGMSLAQVKSCVAMLKGLMKGYPAPGQDAVVNSTFDRFKEEMRRDDPSWGSGEQDDSFGDTHTSPDAPPPDTTDAPSPVTTDAPAPDTTDAPAPATTDVPPPATTDAPAPAATDAPPPAATDAPPPDNFLNNTDDGALPDNQGQGY